MKKLLIQNATVATSTGVFNGDVLVEGETIAAVGQNLPAKGATVINATGEVLLPGGVDAHTHFDLDVGFTRASDDFYTGSVAAAHGGTTTIIDHMAFGPAGCRLTHQVGVYHQLAKDCVIDYALHGVIQHVDEQVLEDMALLRDEEGITSHKVYLTYADMLNDAEVLAVLQRAKQLGVTVCAHCENDAIVNSLRAQFVASGKTAAKYHPLSRPAEAEAEAIFRFLSLAKAAGEAKVYVVHLSTALGLQAIALQRAAGQQNIFAETCPQYLLLNDALYDDPAEGLKYLMSPPLRKTADEAMLWAGLQTGEIDTIGTDHCPFLLHPQKQRGKDDFTQAPNGAPGVELRMPLLFSEGYKKGRLTLPEVVRTCCTRPAEIFGIAPQKGDIQVGADADLVLFNPDEEWTVTHADLHENVDYTPYEGMQLCGKPVLTIARGQVIVKNGKFTGAAGRGKYLHRHV
ncbi:dihydropyrimidinase [Ruminococcaceae bacterium OttesenSCG-928-A16]|nr:dihydropyrimidinase [Ruminococcaceae bacterium OttesenSCG-928-A16]